MSRDKKRRGLSEEEKRLWAAVKRSARPLHAEIPGDLVPEEPRQPPDAPPASAPAGRMPKPKPAPNRAPGALDHRTVSRLSRGLIPVDGRIDLHGLTQSLAHRRLLRFLEEAQASGARLVLVITGKGRPGEAGDGIYERGVLRRTVPEWLRSPAFQPLVSGLAEAGRRHGGGGAVYVRIRRRRD